MSLENARHQKPEQSGRSGRRRGEAESATERDEAESARHDREGSGRGDLLGQALAKENLVRAWKRVKANRGGAGVDGLSIDDTADYLKAQWPQIRA
jgi:RNA-directed DNA polymerase